MGDCGGSHNHVAREHWSGMHNSRTDDNAATAAKEVEYYYYDDDINHDTEASCESSQQVAGEGATTSSYGYRRVRSASGGHTGFLLEDDQIRSYRSNKKDKHAKEQTGKSNTNKGSSHQFEHLQEPSLDTNSDPGQGDDSYETPDYARNQSVHLVSSWLQDARFGEYLEDDSEASRHANAPPARRPPPRRHPAGADILARSASLPIHKDMGHYSQCDTYPEDVQFNALTPGSIYRPERKSLDKAFKLMKIGAIGFASVSKTAAVGLKHKSIEFKQLAIPVLKPILNAVIEESKEQLLGPVKGRGRVHPLQGSNSAQLTVPYVQTIGRGRAGPMQRPPMMRPGMPPGQRPVMRPCVPCNQSPLTRPGMRPGMPPPQGAVRPMAVSAARGQGVAMRGHPRPLGRARPAGPTDPY